MDIKRALPRPQLRDVVHGFEERRVELGSAVLGWPVAARPHQILIVHLADPYRVRINGGQVSLTPDMSVVGPQTYRRAPARDRPFQEKPRPAASSFRAWRPVRAWAGPSDRQVRADRACLTSQSASLFRHCTNETVPQRMNRAQKSGYGWRTNQE
jgi:hypothetical protein